MTKNTKENEPVNKYFAAALIIGAVVSAFGYSYYAHLRAIPHREISCYNIASESYCIIVLLCLFKKNWLNVVSRKFGWVIGALIGPFIMIISMASTGFVNTLVPEDVHILKYFLHALFLLALMILILVSGKQDK